MRSFAQHVFRYLGGAAISGMIHLGLGTLGFTEPIARRMTAEAGFTRFRRLDIDSPFQTFYEVRP